jgi:hypothetical protein
MMKKDNYFTRKENRIILVQNEVALPQKTSHALNGILVQDRNNSNNKQD